MAGPSNHLPREYSALDLPRIEARASATLQLGARLLLTLSRPHTLPAQTLALAHLQPFLSAQTQTLESQLSKTQQANTQLLSEIEAQRAELAALVNGLEHVVRDLEGSVEMLSQDDVQNLTREVLDIDKDLTG